MRFLSLCQYWISINMRSMVSLIRYQDNADYLFYLLLFDIE